MADEQKPGLPTATAITRDRAERVVVVRPRAVMVGGLVAMIGVGVLAVFLWMVPSAAARESASACRGIGGFNPLVPALCPSGACNLPVPAPDFTAVDHQGKPVKLSDFRGKVVLVNFWASWCEVCKTEKPSLAAMTSKLASDDFQVIALASDRTWGNALVATVAALSRSTRLPATNADGDYDMAAALDAYRRGLPDGVPFKIFLDPPEGDDTIGKIASSWGIKAVPESALIDRRGNIRGYFVNKRDWQSPVVQTCLRSIIDED
jgi:thiol-disulfide isomerase/thioredoxin